MHIQLPVKGVLVIGCDSASVGKNPPKVSRRRQLKRVFVTGLADSLHLGHFYGVQLLPELSHLCLYVQRVLIPLLTRYNYLTSRGGLN
jgi:hypothetical protein